MALEIALRLYRKDGCDALLFEPLNVWEWFRVASDENLGSDLRELQSVETALVVDGDLSLGVSDAPALRVGRSLGLEIENAARFALSFHGLGLSEDLTIILLSRFLSLN